MQQNEETLFRIAETLEKVAVLLDDIDQRMVRLEGYFQLLLQDKGIIE